MKGVTGWNPQLADVWSKLHETDGLRITGGEVVGDGTPPPRVTVTWAARLLTLPAVILSVSPVPSKLLVVKTPFALRAARCQLCAYPDDALLITVTWFRNSTVPWLIPFALLYDTNKSPSTFELSTMRRTTTSAWSIP